MKKYLHFPTLFLILFIALLLFSIWKGSPAVYVLSIFVVIGILAVYEYTYRQIVFEEELIKIVSPYSSKNKNFKISEIKYWGERYFSNGSSSGNWHLRIVKDNNESIVFFSEMRQYSELKDFLKNRQIPERHGDIVFKEEILKRKKSKEKVNEFIVICSIIIFFAIGFCSLYLLFGD